MGVNDIGVSWNVQFIKFCHDCEILWPLFMTVRLEDVNHLLINYPMAWDSWNMIFGIVWSHVCCVVWRGEMWKAKEIWSIVSP